MATDDDDAATLRERVRTLEQTVAQQQDTIQQLMPSRRAILAGGAGLVGGAALTGQASAQSAAGQVGTSSEPVDVEAATVNADSVNTGEITTTPASIVVGLSAPQTVANSTITSIEWDRTITEFGGARGALDATNNVVVVPSGYNYALIKSQLRLSSAVAVNLWDHRLNGSSTSASGGNRTGRPDETMGIVDADTPWVEVSAGDEIGQRFRQSSGGSIDINQTADTWLEVTLI